MAIERAEFKGHKLPPPSYLNDPEFMKLIRREHISEGLQNRPPKEPLMLRVQPITGKGH